MRLTDDRLMLRLSGVNAENKITTGVGDLAIQRDGKFKATQDGRYLCLVTS